MRAILLASLLRIGFGAALVCNEAVLTTCKEVADPVITDMTNKDKAINCASQATYEQCYLQNAMGCPNMLTWKKAVEDSKNKLYGEKGIECSGALSTTMPLISGDSGMTSGSQPHASSNSAYGWLAWQAVFLCCCICCLCGGGGGAAAYFMGPGKKKRGASKPKRDYDYQPEAVPLAEVSVDVNNDGIADAVVVGDDKDRDGIPDVMQGDETAKYEVQPLNDPIPPPINDPIPAAVVPVYAEEPNLFGPPPMIMPQASNVMTSYAAPYGNYAQYAQPQYASAYSSYPTTTYAQPTYASQSYAGLQGSVI